MNLPCRQATPELWLNRHENDPANKLAATPMAQEATFHSAISGVEASELAAQTMTNWPQLFRIIKLKPAETDHAPSK